MKKAFTLIELVVTVAILTMVISSVGLIFKVSINTQRTTLANAEIMNKFRTVINQLNSDFRNIRKDAPLFVWFDYKDTDNNGQPDTRFDQIMFFSAGDFHSTQLYDTGRAELAAIPSIDPVFGPEEIIRGNTARIHFGQGQVYSPSDNAFLNPWQQNKLNTNNKTNTQSARILARRRHIFTTDPELKQWPDAGLPVFLSDFGAPVIVDSHYVGKHINIPYNDFLEHDSLSIAKYRTIPSNEYGIILTTCFDYRPLFDRQDPNTFHNLFAENIAEFKIQWAYWNDYWNEPLSIDERQIRWFPSDNPDGETETKDSHFDNDNQENNIIYTDGTSAMFGIFFNIPWKQEDLDSLRPWYPVRKAQYRLLQVGDLPPDVEFPEDFFPKALKFTFTIFDSKGIIENGKTFTHIIYLDD